MASLMTQTVRRVLLDETTTTSTWTAWPRLEEFVGGLRAARCWSAKIASSSPARPPGVLELDLAQQKVNLYGSRYAAYLEERDRARRPRPRGVRRVRGQERGPVERARMQRAWAGQGRSAKAGARPPTGKEHKHFPSRHPRRSGKGATDRGLLEAHGGCEEQRKEGSCGWRSPRRQGRRGGGDMRDPSLRRAASRSGLVTADDWEEGGDHRRQRSGKSTLLGAMLGRLRSNRDRRAPPGWG